VVKKDSAYQSIAELSGKTLAFPAPAAFAAHPRLSAAVVKHTADALIAMSTDEEGGKLLKNLNFNPIGPARDEDWDDVRGLGIALL
jgi:phosphonate transport system substrate-binding protein